jgi:hypothetical protein
VRRIAVLALAPLLALLPLPAHADPGGTCLTVSDPPHLTLGADGIHAYGTFGCTTAVTGITVTVCVDEQGFDSSWVELGCATTSDPASRYHVTGTVVVPMMIYSTTLRSRTTATDDAGDQGSAESPPTPWFNCACSVG